MSDQGPTSAHGLTAPILPSGEVHRARPRGEPPCQQSALPIGADRERSCMRSETRRVDLRTSSHMHVPRGRTSGNEARLSWRRKKGKRAVVRLLNVLAVRVPVDEDGYGGSWSR